MGGIHRVGAKQVRTGWIEREKKNEVAAKSAGLRELKLTLNIILIIGERACIIYIFEKKTQQVHYSIFFSSSFESRFFFLYKKNYYMHYLSPIYYIVKMNKG